MPICDIPEAVKPLNVGMGESLVGRRGAILQSVLGSCIGVVLYCSRLQVAAMAHVVLPASAGRRDLPGKFADTAIPHLISLLAAEGACGGKLVAKIAGAAQMFGPGGPLQIGAGNIGAVKQALATARVPISAEHLGGLKGRRVRLNCATGHFVVEIAGQPGIDL